MGQSPHKIQSRESCDNKFGGNIAVEVLCTASSGRGQLKPRSHKPAINIRDCQIFGAIKAAAVTCILLMSFRWSVFFQENERK